MNTQNVSKDMMEAMAAMVRRESVSPGTTGLSIRTFRALVARGLAAEVRHREFEVTDDGRVFMLGHV